MKGVNMNDKLQTLGMTTTELDGVIMDELKGGMMFGRICNYLCSTNRPASVVYAMMVIASSIRASDPVSAHYLEMCAVNIVHTFGTRADFWSEDALF
jgi:hypothetical protein